MKDLQKKRRSIELGHFEAWLTHGKGSFHFENLSFLRTALHLLLKGMGLLRRGERNALDVKVRAMRLTFPDLPAAFEGFRILFLSDLHIDGLAGLAEAIVEKIGGLEYDLCILGGDYRFEIYGPYLAANRYLEKVVGSIRAPQGVLGILGNHDFAEVAPFLEGLGVTMLVNEAREIEKDGESLWVAGLDDPHYYGCDDLEAALSGVPAGAFKILAVHSPELFREAAAAGVSLYLCGHTHGGQIRLPLLGPMMVNARCPRRLAAGLWRYKRMQGYTSRGAGSSMVPVRFRCPPEVDLIELGRE